jgi:apolipoprotein N-acyltransferase
MVQLKRWALALIPVAMFGGYSIYPAMAFLAFGCLVPWVILYTDDRAPRVSSFYYFVTALAAWIAIYNTTLQYGWYVPLIMGLVLFPFWLPFAPVLKRIHHRFSIPRSLTVPLVWVSVEWLRATFTMSNLDIYGLGYSQARFPAFIQIAEITGVYGVTFMVASVNGWFADLYFTLRENGWSIVATFRKRRILAGASIILAAYAAVGIYGMLRLRSVETEEGPSIALVQPAIKHNMRNIFGVQMTQLLLSETGVKAGEADLIVWPENAILDYVDREVYMEDLAWMSRRKDALMLIGAMGRSEERAGRGTNGAFLIDGEGKILGSYDKQSLFPWTEYVPGDDFLARWWPAAYRLHRRLTRMAWGLVPAALPGKETKLLEMPWNGRTLKFSTLICFENAYPKIPAEAGRGGAKFFVNITSEGAAGGPVQEQLLRIAIFRAVENRMSFVRAGNDGISGFIGPKGDVISLLRGARGWTINVPGVHVDRVPLYKGGRTPYAVSHDAFVKVVLAVTAVLFVLGFRRRRTVAATAIAAAVMIVLAGCGGGIRPGEDSGKVDAALRQGRELHGQGGYAEAIPHLADACATREGCRLAIAPIADCLEKSAAYEDAVVFFERVIERYPELESRALAHLGNFQNRAYDPLGATQSLRRSIDLQPSAFAHARLGTILLELRQEEEALISLEKAVELAPGDDQYMYAYGRALRLAGRLEEAEAILADTVARYPAYGAAWTNLGRVRLQRGDVEAARRALLAALRVEPKNIEALFTLARIALKEGDLAKAEKITLQLIQVEENLGRGQRLQ